MTHDPADLWDGADESDLPRRYPAPAKPATFGALRSITSDRAELVLLDDTGARTVPLVPTPSGTGWMRDTTSKGA
jgi:hypothetical protein